MAEVPLIKTNERWLRASANHHEVFVNVSLSNGSQIFLLTYICGRHDTGCRFDDDDAPDVTWLICTRERRQESVRVCARERFLAAGSVCVSLPVSLCLCHLTAVMLFKVISISILESFFFFFFPHRCCSQTELQSAPSPTSGRRGAIEGLETSASVKLPHYITLA